MNLTTEYDAAWKATLETFLQPCLTLMVPEVARAIDWSVVPRFLDTELLEIVRESEIGSLRVDKLVELHLHDGTGALLMIHAEVQAQRDDQLPQRMFRYYYRILDRFGRPPFSLAILADPSARWRPGPFEHSFEGCSLSFRYATCKLIDLDLAPSLAAQNPVARVIEAHRLAQATKSDVKGRRTGKLGLVRSLLESGMAEVEVREVMRLVHWLLALPKEEEVGFRKDVMEMEATMQPIRRSTYEQIVWEEGVEKGIETGLEQGLRRGLEVGRQEGRQEGRHAAAQELLVELIEERFGEPGESMRRRIAEIRDELRLRQLARAVFQVKSRAEFSNLLDSSGPDESLSALT